MVIMKLKGKNEKQKISPKLAKCAEDPYICNVFHGIRFKVSKDWLSGDNQFFLFIAHKKPFRVKSGKVKHEERYGEEGMENKKKKESVRL